MSALDHDELQSELVTDLEQIARDRQSCREHWGLDLPLQPAEVAGGVTEIPCFV